MSTAADISFKLSSKQLSLVQKLKISTLHQKWENIPCVILAFPCQVTVIYQGFLNDFAPCIFKKQGAAAE